VICLPAGTQFFDALPGELPPEWPVPELDTATWAQAGRAATTFCTNRGFVGGYFSGHTNRTTGQRGILCVRSTNTTFVDASDAALIAAGVGTFDVNAITWGDAGRKATSFCLRPGQGFIGGFFSGHQLPDRKGIVCISESAGP
jgi:hypothetical protein